MAFDGIDTHFSAEQRRRGEDYAQRGHVELSNFDSTSLVGTVRGRNLYHVEIERPDARWHLDCSCPAFEAEGSCKHLWAAVTIARRAIDAAQVASPRSIVVPSNDHALFDARMREIQDRLQRGLAGLTSRSKPTWKSRLDDLERVAESKSAEIAEVALRYVVSVSSARGATHHDLAIQAARRSARGGWLQYRPATLSRDDLDDLPASDQRILAMLWGSPARSLHDSSARTSSFTVAAAVQTTLLPSIALEKRLFLSVDGSVVETPLALDEDEPFEMEIALLADGTEQLTLTARARRGDERIALEDCDALLEGGFVVARGKLSRIDWRGAWAWVAELVRDDDLRLPADEAKRALEVLAKAPGRPLVDAPGFVAELKATPRGVLRLMRDLERGKAVLAQMLFEYEGERLPRRGGRDVFLRGHELVRIERDTVLEAALLARFDALGGRLRTRDAQGNDALVDATELPRLVSTLVAEGWIVEAEGEALRAPTRSSVSVRSGIDWFDVEARLDFDGAFVEMPELLRALRERDHFVRLSNGGRGVLPEKWLSSLRFAAAMSEDGEALRVPKGRAWLLDAWLAEQESPDVDAEFVRVRSALMHGVTPKAADAPPGFQGELRPYQREGLGWLRFLGEIGLGGCLADDMGLGKTVQVLALLLERRERARGPSIVVAPRSVLFNWQREAERFTPDLRVLVHHGIARSKKPEPLQDHDLVVTTYGTLRQDAALLGKIEFDCAILDEAQAIKNAKTISAKAVSLLKADLRLALTGTPVENHLGELFAIFGFLNPTLAKGSRPVQELLNGAKDDFEVARFAARALKPFLLRRTKEEVLKELPAKTEQIVWCELEGREARAYDELKQRYRAELLERADEVGLERMQMNVLEALLRLRQASCHQGLIDPKLKGESSAKLDALFPMLDELREAGHKALVFSQFTSFLEIVRERLDAQGVPYEYLDGQTRDRDERVARFQEDPKVPLFLVSLKAGGFGLNLTAADYVFLLDPWWNPAVERQAIDRTHRIGQTKPVTAYRLVARDTVEEKVLALQEKKRALADALFEGGSATLRDLSRADLEWLLA